MFVKLQSQELLFAQSCPAEVKCEQLFPRLGQGQSHISTFRNAAVVKLVISKQVDAANPHE